MTILVLAPHADDEVLGVGGTIARASSAGKNVVVAVLTGHGPLPHPLWQPDVWDTVRAEAKASADVLAVSQLMFRELPAACLDTTPAHQINQVIFDVIDEIQPTELYVPFVHDLHRDHQAIAYGASVATRGYLPSARSIRRILAYETLSETHLATPYLYPPFQPNVFIDISEHIDRKVEAMRQYASQLQEDSAPRSIAGLRALAQLRGMSIGVAAAEAFVLLRETVR